MVDTVNRAPQVGVMAGLTACAGLNMTCRFTRCVCAIVTADTVSTDACVINSSRLPANGVVAEITLHIRLHVGGMFAGCNATIVTTGAAASNFIVIYPYNR